MSSSIPDYLKNRIRERAGNRCGYCLTHQQYVPWTLEVEHIIPTSKGGTDEENNLWLACRGCNVYKSNHTESLDPETGVQHQIFNPREQNWNEHFEWIEDGTKISGITACGRATVATLNLNSLVAVTVRRNWVSAGWHPPD